MGFSVSDLMIFQGLFQGLTQQGREQIDVLCLGYQDVIVSDAVYGRYFGGMDWKATLRGRENREKLLAIHGGNPALISVVPTLESFFSLYRSEEHTSELQSLMRISYAVFCLKK